MELKDIQDKITTAIKKIAEIELDCLKINDINPEDDFVEKLTINSMSLLELVVELEKEFNIVITPEILPKMTNIKETAKIVKELMTS